MKDLKERFRIDYVSAVGHIVRQKVTAPTAVKAIKDYVNTLEALVSANEVDNFREKGLVDGVVLRRTLWHDNQCRYFLHNCMVGHVVLQCKTGNTWSFAIHYTSKDGVYQTIGHYGTPQTAYAEAEALITEAWK